MDIVEDSPHQGRALLGLAEQTRDYCGVSLIEHAKSASSDNDVVYLVHRCGLLLLFRSLTESHLSTITSRLLVGKCTTLRKPRDYQVSSSVANNYDVGSFHPWSSANRCLSSSPFVMPSNRSLSNDPQHLRKQNPWHLIPRSRPSQQQSSSAKS
jgi:hypothetical protein